MKVLAIETDHRGETQAAGWNDTLSTNKDCQASEDEYVSQQFVW